MRKEKHSEPSQVRNQPFISINICLFHGTIRYVLSSMYVLFINFLFRIKHFLNTKGEILNAKMGEIENFSKIIIDLYFQGLNNINLCQSH